MVVAASRPADIKVAFVLPLDVLIAAWPLIKPVTRPRIFLSAAPADANFADRLLADLEARDIVIWNEQHALGADRANQEERVRLAIRASQAVVLVVSPQTRSSRTVKEHLRLADLYQRRLILVWVGDEPAQPQHYGWRETVLVDAHNTPYETALEAIEATLSQRRSISALLSPAHVAAEEEQKEPRNPYKGLRAFTADDAEDFFGRDRLVDELVRDVEGLLRSEQPALKSGRLLTIIGASGSGKSSVVMAGLLPRLQQGALLGSETWVYLEPIVPSKHPIEALGLTLAVHFPDRSFTSIREDLEDDAARGLHILAKQRGSRVVLLVDQFEELFTQTESEGERQRFIDLLVTATTEPRSPLLVLLTLRADFYHHLMQYPEFYSLIQAQLKPLLPMEIDDLRAAIEQPAALPDVQLSFEGNLVGDLLFEMKGQVGALPLLQFTLEQLFERRSGHRLTLSAYREIGGVEGALSEHAEKCYAALPSEEHRRLSRALFVRLIDPGVTEQDTTRRRAALSEFTLDNPTQTRLMRETLDAFIAARLLATNEIAGVTTIEVSHEALIREWPRLAGWLREAREDIRLQQAINEDATEWEQRNKPGDRLYRGAQLKEAQAWARRNTPSGNEVIFLYASARQQIRSVASIIVLVLLLFSATGVAGWLLSRPDPTHVTTRSDDGPGSLRQAVTSAPSEGTITFDANLRGTILLTSGDLIIAKALKIVGPGAGILSISSGKSGYKIYILPTVALTISGLTFKDSKTSHGIIDNQGTLTLTNSTVSGNTETGNSGGENTPSDFGGGGIVNSGMLTLSNSIVSGNKGTNGGGIVNSGTLTLSNSIVSCNTATIGGGGIYDTGTLTLINSTLSGNRVPNGGGGGIAIDYYGGQLSLIKLLYCTVYNNNAAVGGGIWIEQRDYDVTMGASIVAGNTAHTGSDITGHLTTLGYNLVGDRSGLTFLDSLTRQSTDVLGVSSTDLKIDARLRDNGGSSRTHTQTHALFPGSPAIDAIPLQNCQVQGIFNSRSRMYTDQRGMKRPDGNEPFCDIGAYESP
jgi:hypothetical protein